MRPQDDAGRREKGRGDFWECSRVGSGWGNGGRTGRVHGGGLGRPTGRVGELGEMGSTLAVEWLHTVIWGESGENWLRPRGCGSPWLEHQDHHAGLSYQCYRWITESDKWVASSFLPRKVALKYKRIYYCRRRTSGQIVSCGCILNNNFATVKSCVLARENGMWLLCLAQYPPLKGLGVTTAYINILNWT